MTFFAKIVIGLKTLNGVPRISNEIPRTSLSLLLKAVNYCKPQKQRILNFTSSRNLFCTVFFYLLIYILITYLFTYLFIYFPKMSLIKLIELVTCYLICPYL